MSWLEDGRIGVRALWKERGFTCGAIAVLALGIGANTSVFTLMKSILLQPLPMKNPQELVAVWTIRPDGGTYPFTIPAYIDVRDRNEAFAGLVASARWNANLSGEATPERLVGVRASGNVFQVLGVDAELGRTLEADDDAPAKRRVAVITHGLWQRRFAGDRSVLGKTMRLDGDFYTIVGVLPPAFAFKLPEAEFAVPLAPDADPWRYQRESIAFLRLWARLKPGLGRERANANLRGLVAQLRREYPAGYEGVEKIEVTPLSEDITGGSRTTLVVLMSAVALVLLIACANISSLLIARSARRRKDLAIRAALGGTRWRLARQQIVEILLLFMAGGAAGLLLARWGVALLLMMTPANLPRLREVHLDATVLLVGLAMAIGCGLIFGALPVIRLSGSDFADSLRAATRGSSSDVGRGRLRSALVVCEIALSLVLLTGAGLLLRSFQRLISVKPGFQSEGITTLRVSLPSTRYTHPADVALFHDQLLWRITAIPGVDAAGATSILPLSGPLANSDFEIEGHPPVTEKDRPSAEYRMIDSTYFKTMGIPIVGGRDFSDLDTAASQRVIIISKSLASLYWKKQNPVGTHIRIDEGASGKRYAEVVGVSRDVKEISLEKRATPVMFVPMEQASQDATRFLSNSMFWVVRGHTPRNLAGLLKEELAQVDGDAAGSAGTMDMYVDQAASTRRFSLRIVAFFALTAMLLAAGGIYGLVSYTTSQRTREFGVRLALGAGWGDVAALVMREGLKLAGLGVAAGAAAGMALSHAASSMLYEIRPDDPVSLGAAGAALMIVTLAATFGPARRAMRVDPVEALRAE